jgi:soluble lytic murein transglycosylase-like protein
MAALSILLIMAAAAPPPETVGTWMPLIDQAAIRFHLPSDWIARVMGAESGGRTWLFGRSTRSAAGAIGLMQLMPGTWFDMRTAYGLGSDPDEPADNIAAGAAYLRILYDRFGYPGLFAAYNAGPARYAAYLAGRSSLPAETRHYLATLAGLAPVRLAGMRPPLAPTLFAVRHDRSVALAPPAERPAGSSLFALEVTSR